jgi:hypothetical protein
MPKYRITYTDGDGKTVQLPGTWDGGSPAHAIAVMLLRTGERDDRDWKARET